MSVDDKRENPTLDVESGVPQLFPGRSFDEKMMEWKYLMEGVNARLSRKYPATMSDGTPSFSLRLGCTYSEKEAAEIVDVYLGTLKRWARGKKDKVTGEWLKRPRFAPGVHFAPIGERDNRYSGTQICRILTGEGLRPDDPKDPVWANTPNGNSPSGNGGSATGKASTTAAVSTGVPDKQSVSALAQKTFSKRKTA